jgi:2-dehydro-3-deoxyphosphogluconate aldolase/(4S)-4-hydroxy-2-oxoglutarate aldolase
MNNTDILPRLLDNGIFAVIRLDDTNRLFKVVEAINNGGIKNIEITLTVPNAVESIKKLLEIVDEEIIIGAGTVLSSEEAEKVISAGAKFVVSPVLDMEVIDICKNNKIPIAPGCYSPTEILKGWNAGASIIKIFPATSLGPRYFKDLHAPLPFVKMMPTGGVTTDNVGEWIAAGACAVAIGSDLLDKKVIAEEKYQVLTDRAKRLVSNFFEARLKLK